MDAVVESCGEIHGLALRFAVQVFVELEFPRKKVCIFRAVQEVVLIFNLGCAAWTSL